MFPFIFSLQFTFFDSDRLYILDESAALRRVRSEKFLLFFVEFVLSQHPLFPLSMPFIADFQAEVSVEKHSFADFLRQFWEVLKKLEG